MVNVIGGYLVSNDLRKRCSDQVPIDSYAWELVLNYVTSAINGQVPIDSLILQDDNVHGRYL